MKKTISLMLTSVMLLSMTATAFAGEPLNANEASPRVLETYSIEELRKDPSVTFETEDNAVMRQTRAGNTYSSTIDISCFSSLIGAERSYTGNNYRCTVSNAVLDYSPGELTVKVGTKNFMDITVQGSSKLTLSNSNTSGIANLGYCGAGKKIFKFVTGEAAISADVVMESY